MSALPQVSALSFVTYLPVRRTIPYANRSQPRRPTEGPADENSDAVPRSSRSLPGSNQRNQNRRRSPQQSQPTSSASRSASDLFGFFDGEENGDLDVPNLAQKRPERPRSRRRESINDSKGAEGENSFEEGTPKPDGDSAGIDEEIILEDPDARDGELIDIDDNIDGGFYSRYRKEAGPGQRVVDYSSLDAQEQNSSEGDKNSQEGPARRMDRETAAANAFDAVDKLFGSINLGKQGIMKKGVAPRKQKPDGGKGTGRPQTGQIDRAKWLADLKARASTKGARDLLAGEGDEDSLAVDVNAVDDDSLDNGTESIGRGAARDEFHSATDDRFEEAEIGDESGMNSFAPRKSGFRAQKRAVRVSESSENPSTPPDGEEKQDTTPTQDKSDGETSFQKMMAIAREGPNASPGNRSKQPRSIRPSVVLRNRALRNGNPQKRKEPQERKTTREPRIDEGRAPPASNISRILGLTKQIDSMQADASRDKDDDSYEALDDEMEESISIRGDAIRKGSSRRQKFTAVRRVANRSFKIHKPPDEWKPMTEAEIAKVRSDGRSIEGGRIGNSKGKGVVANCQICRGSGLDTCSACLGSGWVPPLDTIGVSESRKELLEKIWNRPNLCVDNFGEAQCILCNGIGKQFCNSCKGSGSALRKGFSLSEKREIFDLDDPEEDDSCFGEDEYADGDEDDVDEYEEDEEDEYQLYTGPEESFNFHRTSTSFNTETDDGDGSDDNLRIGNEDELEVDDESAELLATLEAMHLADLEERGSEYMGDRKRRSEVNNRARNARDAGFDLDIESDGVMDDVSGEHGIEESMKMTGLDDEDDLDDDLDEEDDDLDNDDDDDLDDDDEDDMDDDIDDDRIVNEIESRGLELNLDDVSEDDDELE